MRNKILISLLVAAGCLSTSFADTAIEEKAEELARLAADPSVSMDDLSAAVYDAARSHREGADLFLKIVLDARSLTTSAVELSKVVHAVLVAVPEVGQNFARALQAQMNNEVVPTVVTGAAGELTTRVVNVVFSNTGVRNQLINQTAAEPALTPAPVLPTPGGTSVSY